MATDTRRTWFYLDITTGDADDAGTDGPVHVRLIDARGTDTADQVLGRYCHDRFRRGTSDRHFMTVPDRFAVPARVFVQLAGEGRWLLAEIEVTTANASTRYTTGRQDVWLHGGPGTVLPLQPAPTVHTPHRPEPRHRAQETRPATDRSPGPFHIDSLPKSMKA
ncbi:hypothetical protein ACFXPA_48725 [Amycolatopsis sp. NPDC059090]|uniref:hypothetical protein n=1 Tax=Amycolatopsis sp. NPDC059090 TaxID=3346723 RepID=UPI00366AFC53